MDANTPMVLAAARYKDREDAVRDFKDVWRAKHEGSFDHIAAAVLTKDDEGNLQVERHDSTAKHLGWGGALLGAALVVVAPPAGVATLATVGGLAGAGGLVGHFWHNIPKKKVQEASDLLESGDTGLLIVAVNPEQGEIASLLSRAEKTVAINTVAGDLETVFDNAVRDAQEAKSKASV